MSEAIQKYVFANANEVRVVMMNNEPWFVAKDVCKALEITKVDSAIRNLDADEKGTHTVSTPGGNQKMTIVSQAGLDSLILRGRKQEAKAFRRWVTHEVLPSIRKHGVYMTDRTLDIIKDDPAYIYRIAEMLVEEKKQRELAESERDDAIKTVNEQNSTIREQQSRIEWCDNQRIGMAESCARFSPIKDKPCDDAKAVRGYWKKPVECADGEFDVKRNGKCNAMISRAIRERSIMDYELNEFLTVIEADDIKGTKHTKDECTLLSMLNAGHIGVIPTIF